MYACPQCGGREIEAVRKTTIFETITLIYVDGEGNYEERYNELGDTCDNGEWLTRSCLACGAKLPCEPEEDAPC